MTIYKKPTQMSDKTVSSQSGITLPVVLAGVAAAALGFIAYPYLTGSDDNPANNGQLSTTQSTNADNAALASMQENLQTSLALPDDFRTVPEFNLVSATGNPVNQSVFEDQWSLVFFGFTHCPDVCPITLQVMKEIVANLEEQQLTAPQIVFVSIDPARDTPEIMEKYIGYFDKDFVGITGDVNAVLKFTSSLGIVASFTANATDPENYGVDHTASLLLIDPQGRVKAKVTPPHEAEKITADLVLLTAQPS